MRVKLAWFLASSVSWRDHSPRELAGEELVVNLGIVDAPGAVASRIPPEADGH